MYSSLVPMHERVINDIATMAILQYNLQSTGMAIDTRVPVVCHYSMLF